jgi:hypothetical protein
MIDVNQKNHQKSTGQSAASDRIARIRTARQKCASHVPEIGKNVEDDYIFLT